MSYCVQYSGNIEWEINKNSWGFRRVFLTIMCFLLFAGMVSGLWEDGKQVLLQMLLPGDASVAWSMLERFADHLYQGIPFSVAAEEFCYGIVQTVY